MTEAKTKQVPCQVRINTESSCPRRAEVEILGVAFCEPCAHQQKAYFAIGELTQEKAKGLRGMSLAETLERMQRGRTVSTEGIAAEMPHGLSGIGEIEPVAPRSG